MSAEGMPHEQQSWAEWPMLWITRLVVRHPIATLVVAGLITIASTVLSQTRLGFRTSRLDLLNPKSDFNRLWIDYLKEFGEGEDAVVVVEGAQAQQIVPVLREVSLALRREPQHFRAVLEEVDQSKLRAKGLHYVSMADLLRIDQFLDQFDPVLRGNWAALSLGNMQAALAQQMATPGAGFDPRLMGQFAQSLLAALEGRYQSPWPEMSSAVNDEQEPASSQFLSGDGRIGFVLLKFAESKKNSLDFVRDGEAIERLREVLATTQARHREVKIGLTGLPVIEHDEMASSQTSMTEVSLLSLIGVSVLFIAGFGGWRHPLLAVASLTLGTAWSFGYIALVVGHLNILSSAFAVILVGQGIDFSMYYVAQYLVLRRTMKESGPALVETARSVGPGIATGAVTTSVAFFMAGLTEFTGVAELGIIAGGGILLCWIAGVTVLPAMIHLTDTWWPCRRLSDPVDIRSWLEPLLARPRLLLAVTSLATLFVATGLSHLSYDYNLLHMQASGIESVDLEQKLLSQCDHSASFALSMAGSPEEVIQRKQQFLRLPSVKRVEEIASRFPRSEPQKAQLVARIHQRLGELPPQAPQLPLPALGDLGQMLMQMQSAMAGSPQAAALVPMERLSGALMQLPPQEVAARLSAYQQQMAAELLGHLRKLQGVSNPAPPALGDLPDSLVTRFVGKHGKHLMKIHCRGDIWDMAAMEQFVREVRSIDPRATGNPMQVYEASIQMKRSYEEAALYAFLIIVPVVFFDFRSIKYTLLAMLPLGLGMAQMFGLMGLLNVPFNPANMIVLPLILGIGIDAGVHVVHDFRSQTGRYRINSSTASAVVINTVTNMAGFGSLMIASHRGLQSLGRVLTLGLGTCLFTALIMLPAALVWLGNRRRSEAANEAAAALARESDAHRADKGRADGEHEMPPAHHRPASEPSAPPMEPAWRQAAVTRL